MSLPGVNASKKGSTSNATQCSRTETVTDPPGNRNGATGVLRKSTIDSRRGDKRARVNNVPSELHQPECLVSQPTRNCGDLAPGAVRSADRTGRLEGIGGRARKMVIVESGS